MVIYGSVLQSDASSEVTPCRTDIINPRERTKTGTTGSRDHEPVSGETARKNQLRAAE